MSETEECVSGTDGERARGRASERWIESKIEPLCKIEPPLVRRYVLAFPGVSARV